MLLLHLPGDLPNATVGNLDRDKFNESSGIAPKIFEHLKVELSAHLSRPQSVAILLARDDDDDDGNEEALIRMMMMSVGKHTTMEKDDEEPRPEPFSSTIPFSRLRHAINGARADSEAADDVEALKSGPPWKGAYEVPRRRRQLRARAVMQYVESMRLHSPAL
ncbi:unnamed protein product [Nippostrongylus brasiliensis]|uniref:CUE domain-containing protein n=1 Tax=Nippostrongylus brasiliensis TaxID=27835 RepID=A0A158R088_NIPBR|nr:unnamed protein product [Nippostrongylus brasiliensis]